MLATEKIMAMIEPVTSQLSAYRENNLSSSGENTNKLTFGKTSDVSVFTTELLKVHHETD